jgi:Uncharacterized conserved protein
VKQAVLISINPKWCELIASGKKTIEVRKTKPKLLPPFKCYIYCTKMDDPIKYHGWTGYVIGEFICDWCDPFQPRRADFAELSLGSLVPPRELYEYAKGKTLYGWHITDLKLYAEPKEISEFKRWNRTEQTAPCAHVYALYSPCESCTECNLKRAPQSWTYVEEVDG